MTTAISNKHLMEKVRRFVRADTSKTDLDRLIQDALISSFRQINELRGDIPMAWNVEYYDEIFTRYYASISALTAANPGVATADSLDPDLSSDHGFQTNDIAWIDGINGANSLHRMNRRLFRAVRASATTMSYKALDGNRAIDTSNYAAYSSGGYIYHSGIILPRSTIEPSGGTAAEEWSIKRVFGVKVDGYPCDPITEEIAVERCLNRSGGQPRYWRYQKYAYADFAIADVEHALFWYPYPPQRYNLTIMIEKSYPDMDSWGSDNYPMLPAPLHDYLWRRALSNMATHADSMRRRSVGKDGEYGDNTRLEIANAANWMRQAKLDEIKIIQYSKQLSGDIAYADEGIGA